jgi:hypothetical protein
VFRWLDFCRDRSIPFEDKGRNIYIDCPFCVGGEGKAHLGLSTASTKWGCWKGHKGHDAWYLVKRLAKCTEAEARCIASEGEWSSADFASMQQRFAALEPLEQEREQEPKGYKLPEDCFPLGPSQHCALFCRYLEERGLDVEACISKHDVYGARTGEFAWRVVLPFYHRGKLVGATGRHIGKSTIRYHTMPAGVTSRIVYNGDLADMRGGDALVLVEGPFDCMVLDQAFDKLDMACTAVALLGLGFGPDKRREVARIARRFERVVVLTDRNAEAHAFQIRQDLESSVRRVSVALLPAYAKDPAELRLSDVCQL